MELCEELGDTPGQGEVLGNHAPCHSVLGQLKIATNSFAKEIQISELTNDTMMKGAVTPIWSLLHRRGGLSGSVLFKCLSTLLKQPGLRPVKEPLTQI